MARKKLGEMLVEAGVLTGQSLQRALSEQRRWGGSLGRMLVELKLINEADLVTVLATQLNLQTVDLDKLEIHPMVLELIPGELAEQHSIVPFAQPMKFLDVAMADPTNVGISDELRIRTQLNIRPFLAGPKMIERALAKHYRRGSGRFTYRGADVSLDHAGDTLTLDDEASRQRPNTAEIDAARRREGLRSAPAPGRPQALLDMSLPSEPPANRDAEIDALQERISALEALVARDEDVLRKLLALLVEKGVATREEILESIR